MNKNLLFYIFLVLIIVFGPVVWIFKEYRSNFGTEISSNPNDWTLFASIFSGAFTYVAAIGTTLTLLFLVRQQLENSKIVNRQLAIQSFDSYQRHRDIFFSFLDEIARSYDAKIIFPERDRFYHSVFSKNDPYETDHNVKLIEDGSEQYGDLTDCKKKYEHIGKMLDGHEAGRNIIADIADLNYLIGLKPRENKPGDILFHDRQTGVNVNDISESLKIIESVLNKTLTYTKNPTVESIYQKAEGDTRVRIENEIRNKRYSEFKIVT